MRRALSLALLALLLAGCGATEERSVATLDETTLLARAVGDMPPVWTAHLRLLPLDAEEITLSTTYDAPRNTTYARLGGSAETLARIGGTVGAGDYLARGLSIHRTPAGVAYVANGTAFAHPPDGPGARRAPGAASALERGPVATLLDVDAQLAALVAPDARIVGSTATTWEEADALQMEIEGPRVNATAVVTRTEPPRLVHLRTRIAADPDRPASVIDDATLVGTFHDRDVEIMLPPPEVERALGLAYVVERAEGELRWRFVGTGGVPLGEVEVQVKRPPPNGSAPDPSILPTAWSFSLAAREAARDNVSLSFEDADGDGAVSEGDVLRARPTGGQALAPLVLVDLVTGTRVVPLSAAVLLVALGLACSRRRHACASIP